MAVREFLRSNWHVDAAAMLASGDAPVVQHRMPIAYEGMTYLLRNHIGVVRNRLVAPLT